MGIKKLSKILITALVILVLTPASVFAASKITQEKVVILPVNETVEGTYLAAGEKVTVLGTVMGDAYIAGGNVFIEGTINGDLLLAGGTVNILGNVTNDIRVAGGNIVISGEVGGNVTSLGGNVTYTDSADIGGSIVNGSGSLTLLSPVSKDATIASGNITLNSAIGGDVTAGVGNLNLNSKANIAGDLNYWSNNDAQIFEGAQVQGQTVRNEIEEPQGPQVDNLLASISAGFRIISFFSAILIGFLLLKLVPNFTQKTADTILRKPLRSFGIGLLTLIVTPPVIVLLLITVIGIPLGIIAIAGYIIILYIAKIFVALAIGRVLLRSRNKNIYLAFTLGLVVYSLFRIIPIAGFIIAALTATVGTGAYISTKVRTHKKLKEKKLI